MIFDTQLLQLDTLWLANQNIKGQTRIAIMRGQNSGKVGERESLDRILEVARAARNLNVINNARRGGKREAVIHL